MAQLPVGTKGAQERLLIRVLRNLSAEEPSQLAQNGVAVLLVELLERWRLWHRSHHLL